MLGQLLTQIISLWPWTVSQPPLQFLSAVSVSEVSRVVVSTRRQIKIDTFVFHTPLQSWEVVHHVSFEPGDVLAERQMQPARQFGQKGLVASCVSSQTRVEALGCRVCVTMDKS